MASSAHVFIQNCAMSISFILVVMSAVRSASRRYVIAASRQSLLLFATVAPAATGLNRHSPGSASPPGLSTSALGQDLEFARKRPLSQCWIEAPVPYVEIRSCPNSNGGTIEAD
jgi:hypothetical protein